MKGRCSAAIKEAAGLEPADYMSDSKEAAKSSDASHRFDFAGEECAASQNGWVTLQ
jgi:hypothetical protein